MRPSMSAVPPRPFPAHRLPARAQRPEAALDQHLRTLRHRNSYQSLMQIGTPPTRQ
jgi:hypothetical protein